MKRSRCRMYALASVLVLIASTLAWAQPPPGGARILRIRKISGNKIETPQYRTMKSQFVGRSRDWFQIDVEYETAPDWVDEVDVTVYVLCKATSGRVPYTCFRGQVTYVNIEKGKHKADMYLHPSTIARYGPITRIGVLAKPKDGLVEIDSQPSSNERWWEQFSPVEGYVLNRMQTPFAMLNFDDYEAVKVPVAR